MARTRSDLPRMQKQAPIRAPRPPAVAPAAQTTEKPARKPQMMRQYDLIERVRRYNPNTNEALLNRAYVYAMKAHGEQRRASGDPYFSHPIEVAAILTDLKLDDATIAAAKGYTYESPRGTILIDAETRDVVHDIYIRRVVKENGRLINREFDVFKMVKDPGK